MKGILHITNGESAVALMRLAGLPGEFLSWDDPLHDGPAPAGLPLSEFSSLRADFLAGCGFAERAEARRRFQTRDSTLFRFSDFGEVILWFEHDLYDQLQLIQLLDWFRGRNLQGARLTLVQTDRHLGESPADAYPALLKSRRAVTRRQLDRARQVWRAFTSPDPTEIERARTDGRDPLPHIEAALLRHLEEFPSTVDGLGRTELQILKAVSEGHHDPAAVFAASQGAEEARFQGDWSFWLKIEALFQGPHPLLAAATGPFRRPPLMVDHAGFHRQRLSLTADGAAVLAGLKDRVGLNGYRSWLGGALLEPGRMWRWDRSRKHLTRHH